MAVPIETYRTILNLHNPRANAETCPGHSTPRNRRCAIPLGPENQAQVNNVLGLIRDTPADIPALVALVANLTQALLCRHHLLQDRHRVGMALIEAFMEQKWLEEDEDEDEDEEEEEQEEEYELADLEDVVLPRPVLPRPPVNSNQGVYVGGSVCGICLDETTDTVLTPCGHCFCLGCNGVLQQVDQVLSDGSYGDELE